MRNNFPRSSHMSDYLDGKTTELVKYEKTLLWSNRPFLKLSSEIFYYHAILQMDYLTNNSSYLPLAKIVSLLMKSGTVDNETTTKIVYSIERIFLKFLIVSLELSDVCEITNQMSSPLSVFASLPFWLYEYVLTQFKENPLIFFCQIHSWKATFSSFDLLLFNNFSSNFVFRFVWLLLINICG